MVSSILTREWLVPVTGPMLQEEERLVLVNGLGHSEFKVSNGWLQRFKDRHNIKQLVVSGEAGDVAEEMIEAWQQWQERLSHLFKDMHLNI